jgi:DNA-directed RNA polymerase specialized sigma subunit
MKKNQQDIAKSLEISQSYVSRIERKILIKMKREYEKIVV